MDRMNGEGKMENQGNRGNLKKPGKWKRPTMTQVFIFIFLLGIAVYVVGSVWQMFSSFEERVSGRINLQDITSIEIIRSSPTAPTPDEAKITLTDRTQIAKNMSDFADVKLMSSYAPHKITRNYWISIYVNRSPRFGIYLDDQKYIYIDDTARKDKYSSGSFKITNHYDMQFIDSLFP